MGMMRKELIIVYLLQNGGFGYNGVVSLTVGFFVRVSNGP